MTDTPHQTALYQQHERLGAKLVDFAGWLMPIRYASIVTEHLAARNAVALFDVSHMGRFRFTGPAAVHLLDGLLTRRVTTLKPGDVRYAMITNDQGMVLDDVLVSRYPQADTFGLVVNASNRAKLLAWIQPHIGNYDVQFVDETEGTSMIAVQGPKAVGMLNNLVGGVVPDNLKYYELAEGSWQGMAITISRTGYTGEDGFELTIPAELASEVWQTLLAAAEPIGGCAAGLGARDTLRLEAGMPLYGHELSETLSPYDVGLGFAVQLKDRQFPGREALLQQKTTPQRERIGLVLGGKRVPREGYAVFRGDQRIGEVSSGTFSPTLQYPIAMALVTANTITVGDTVEVDIRGQRLSAKVVELPFYKRN